MALVPYRRRNFDTAFGAPAAPLSRNVRSRYTVAPGMARGISRRGARYGRASLFRNLFSFRSQHTNPVYPRPEVKSIDINIPSTPIDNAGTLATSLGSIIGGTNLSQRIGNQISVKSVYYQYVLNFGTGPVPNAVRHLLVWDRQPNSILPPVTSVLASFPAGADLLTSPMNLTNRDRFVVLVDERTTLSPNGDQIRICSGFRKINQRSTFATSAATLPSTGLFVSYFVSDETVLANEPLVYGTWRLRYIDN